MADSHTSSLRGIRSAALCRAFRAWCVLVVVCVAHPRSAFADRVFGADLRGPTAAQGLTTLRVDEGGGDFDVILLLVGLDPADITGAEIRDAGDARVFDLVGQTGAGFEEGGDVVRLAFTDQPLPSGDFVSRLDAGLFIVVTTRTHPNGVLRSQLIPTPVAGPPPGGPGGGTSDPSGRPDGDGDGTGDDDTNDDDTTDDEDPIDEMPEPDDDDGAGQPVTGGGDDGGVDVGDMVPPCGVCGPIGLAAYAAMLVGWVALRITSRRP